VVFGLFLSGEHICVGSTFGLLCVVLTSHCEFLTLLTVGSVWHAWTPGMFLNVRSPRSAVITLYFRSRLRKTPFWEVF
jgi:hypothetical protein